MWCSTGHISHRNSDSQLRRVARAEPSQTSTVGQMWGDCRHGWRDTCRDLNGDKALYFNPETKKNMPSVCRLKGKKEHRRGWWRGNGENTDRGRHRRCDQEWEEHKGHRAQHSVWALCTHPLANRLAKHIKECGSNYDWQSFTYQKLLGGFLSNSMTNITKMRGAYLWKAKAYPSFLFLSFCLNKL